MFIPLWLIVIISIAVVVYYLGVKSSVGTYQDNVHFERKRHARFIETITEAAAKLEYDSLIKIAYALNDYASEVFLNLKFRPGQESLDRANHFFEKMDNAIETMNEGRESFESHTGLTLKLYNLDSRIDYPAEALSMLLARIDKIKAMRHETY